MTTVVRTSYRDPWSGTGSTRDIPSVEIAFRTAQSYLTTVSCNTDRIDVRDLSTNQPIVPETSPWHNPRYRPVGTTLTLQIVGEFPSPRFVGDIVSIIGDFRAVFQESYCEMFRSCNIDNIQERRAENPIVLKALRASGMFGQATSERGHFRFLSRFDVSRVTCMDEMFEGISPNQTFDVDLIRGWNVSNVTSMKRMFAWSSINPNLSEWDVSRVTNMEKMFLNAVNFNQDISRWNVRSVTTMDGMFENAKAFTGVGLRHWRYRVQRVESMDRMFRTAESFKENLSSWQLHPKVVRLEVLGVAYNALVQTYYGNCGMYALLNQFFLHPTLDDYTQQWASTIITRAISTSDHPALLRTLGGILDAHHRDEDETLEEPMKDLLGLFKCAIFLIPESFAACRTSEAANGMYDSLVHYANTGLLTYLLPRELFRTYFLPGFDDRMRCIKDQLRIRHRGSVLTENDVMPNVYPEIPEGSTKFLEYRNILVGDPTQHIPRITEMMSSITTWQDAIDMVVHAIGWEDFFCISKGTAMFQEDPDPPLFICLAASHEINKHPDLQIVHRQRNLVYELASVVFKTLSIEEEPGEEPGPHYITGLYFRGLEGTDRYLTDPHGYTILGNWNADSLIENAVSVIYRRTPYIDRPLENLSMMHT